MTALPLLRLLIAVWPSPLLLTKEQRVGNGEYPLYTVTVCILYYGIKYIDDVSNINFGLPRTRTMECARMDAQTGLRLCVVCMIVFQ